MRPISVALKPACATAGKSLPNGQAEAALAPFWLGFISFNSLLCGVGSLTGAILHFDSRRTCLMTTPMDEALAHFSASRALGPLETLAIEA